MRCTICDRRDDLPGGPAADHDLCDDCYRAVGAAIILSPSDARREVRS